MKKIDEITVSDRILDELLDSDSDDELELAPEAAPLVITKPTIKVKLITPQPIAVVGVPDPEREADPEEDAVKNLLSEIPESQEVDLLPSGLNAVELGYASIPVIILEKAKADSEEENQIGMGIYLGTPKTDKFSEDGENGWVRCGLSSMQGWRATMEGAHAAYPDLDASTSFFGDYDGHGGKVVAKFCAKYLHRQVLKNEAYAAGDIGTSVQKAFFSLKPLYGVSSFSSSKPSLEPSVPPYCEENSSSSTSATASHATSSTYDNQVCPICLTNPKDMAFGCEHQTCCECGQDLQTCPNMPKPNLDQNKTLLTRCFFYIISHQ